MVSVIYLCLAVSLATSCLAAPRPGPGHTRHLPSLTQSNFRNGARPGIFSIFNQITTFFNAASSLEQLDYDQLLALLEEYFKGR